jgi:soluble lytic murein transglycosylase
MRFSFFGLLQLSFLGLVCFFTVVRGQNTRVLLEHDIENHDYAATLELLGNLESNQSKSFKLNNLDYLDARLSERAGDLGRTEKGYQSTVARESVLKEYALLHLAALSRSAGNLLQERVYLKEIQTEAPDSLLSATVSLRLPRSYFESRDYKSAIALLSQPSDGSGTSVSKEKTNRLARSNLVLLAQAYMQNNQPDEARNLCGRLVDTVSNPTQPDDFALDAIRILDFLDTGPGNPAEPPKLSEAEHLKRASIYQFNRDFAAARPHFLAVVQEFPQSPSVPAVLFQVGRGFTQDGSYEEALKWYERMLGDFPGVSESRDALLQAASCYSRLGKPKEAVSRYQSFIDKYPDADSVDRAYLNIIDTERDRGDNSSALKWADRTREVFRGKPGEALAVFARAKIHLSQKNFREALIDLEELQNFSNLGDAGAPSGTSKSEILYLKALAFEQMQKYPEAFDAYLALPDGRTEYFGGLATERLKNLFADERTKPLIEPKLGQLRTLLQQPLAAGTADSIRQAAQSVYRITGDRAVLEVIRKTYALVPAYQKPPAGNFIEFGRREPLQDKRTNGASPHQAIADELLFLGLYDEATPELEVALHEKSGKAQASGGAPAADAEYTLAVLYRRGNMADRTIAYSEPRWKPVPADYQIDLIPIDQLEMLYPAPFADFLLSSAGPRGMDPRFELSLMRTESRYNPGVKSYAAARGLMQFISSTGSEMAAQLGRNNFKQDELYDPATAVLFGSQYLSNLFKLFPNQPPAVAASYNGGETNVARWLARAGTDDPNFYVPEIVFSQSKDYVYKVMASYRMYKIIYDETLKLNHQ